MRRCKSGWCQNKQPTRQEKIKSRSDDAKSQSKVLCKLRLAMYAVNSLCRETELESLPRQCRSRAVNKTGMLY